MPCKECNATVVVGRGFCKSCYYKHRRNNTLTAHPTKKRSLEERFASFFKRTILTSKGCLEWTGQRRGGKFNYGVITIEVKGQRHSKLLNAHRVSYQVYKGPIPEGLNVLHTCDNPPCVNPAHLFLGTKDANNKDCKKKGRNARGETNGQHKLTEHDILSIRNSKSPQAMLATRFKVAQPTISRIKNGKRWKHLT